MKIDRDTTIDSLLKAYPQLEKELPSISHHFEKLGNPFIRKTMGKVATVGMAASVAGLDPDDLVRRIEALATGHGGAGAAERRETLKGLIMELHGGADPEEVKARFKELFSGVSATEIAGMEQALLDEGMPAEEIQRLCDVHVAVFKDALEARDAPEVATDHPVHHYMEENRKAEEILSTLNILIGLLGRPPAAEAFEKHKEALLGLTGELSKIRLHYERKENQLFPSLEAHHFTGPTQVMWSIHDAIRADLKAGAQALENSDALNAVAKLRVASQAIRDMIYKEEHILFPTAIDLLSAEEWEKMAAGERAIGFAWINPDESPGAAPEPEKPAATMTEGVIGLDTGRLTADQVNLLLKNLPVDVTFVDENDRVAYYSEGAHRIFPRSPAIIGREVRNCHPPKSVHVVNMILDAFKTGEKSVAEFWLTMGEKFIHIRYFALRDDEGRYRGCIEVSQEISGLRALTGQRRLLEWE